MHGLNTHRNGSFRKMGGKPFAERRIYSPPWLRALNSGMNKKEKSRIGRKVKTNCSIRSITRDASLFGQKKKKKKKKALCYNFVYLEDCNSAVFPFREATTLCLFHANLQNGMQKCGRYFSSLLSRMRLTTCSRPSFGEIGKFRDICVILVEHPPVAT